jgi:hypothetical protein
VGLIEVAGLRGLEAGTVEGAAANVPGRPSVRRRVRAWTIDCQLTRLDEISVAGVTRLGSQ